MTLRCWVVFENLKDPSAFNFDANAVQIASLLGLLGPEDESTKILRNLWNSLPKDASSQVEDLNFQMHFC